jgi:hypothetical protein
MKLTVQVVLHTDDQTETVVREVFTLQREEPLAPGTLGLQRERGKPWEASYERGWSVNPVLVSCSLSTRIRISITASGPRLPALTPSSARPPTVCPALVGDPAPGPGWSVIDIW